MSCLSVFSTRMSFLLQEKKTSILRLESCALPSIVIARYRKKITRKCQRIHCYIKIPGQVYLTLYISLHDLHELKIFVEKSSLGTLTRANKSVINLTMLFCSYTIQLLSSVSSNGLRSQILEKSVSDICNHTRRSRKSKVLHAE